MNRHCKYPNCDKLLNPSQQKFCFRQHAMASISGKKIPKRKTNEEYIEDVLRVKDKIGHYPTNAEYLIHGTYHPATLWKYMGAWANILEKAGYIKPKPNWSINDISPEDGGWLAEIVAEEGSFMLSPVTNSNKTRFTPILAVAQRDDNYMLISEIIKLWKIDKTVSRLVERGHLENPQGYLRKPTLSLHIAGVETLYYKILPTFNAYPLRSKKHNEFLVFEKAVKLLMNKRLSNRHNLRYTDNERKNLISYYNKLKALRIFKSRTNMIFQLIAIL